MRAVKARQTRKLRIALVRARELDVDPRHRRAIRDELERVSRKGEPVALSPPAAAALEAIPTIRRGRLGRTSSTPTRIFAGRRRRR